MEYEWIDLKPSQEVLDHLKKIEETKIDMFSALGIPPHLCGMSEVIIKKKEKWYIRIWKKITFQKR